MTEPLYVELSCDGWAARLNGRRGGSAGGLHVSSDGVDGWYSTPDAKVQMTEMQTGDGAHAVEESQVLYAARTVTVHWVAIGASRAAALADALALLAAAHRIVRLRVVDADSDTYAMGYVQVSSDADVAREVMSGTLTVVCADPRRYSTEARRVQLFPASKVSGGLFYGDEGGGLAYDLNYGSAPETLQNLGTLSNGGTADAYPVVTLTGPLQGSLRLDWDGGSVAYSQPVGAVPLTLDSLTRTASVQGLDTSRYLTSRGFPVVPAGGSISVNLQAVGTGWATVEWHDTYI